MPSLNWIRAGSGGQDHLPGTLLNALRNLGEGAGGALWCVTAPQGRRLSTPARCDGFNRLLEKTHVARYGVEIRLEMLMYYSIHGAFLPDFAWSRAHLSLFQQPVNPDCLSAICCGGVSG